MQVLTTPFPIQQWIQSQTPARASKVPLPPGTGGSGSPVNTDGPKSPRKAVVSPTRTNDANLPGMIFGQHLLKSPTQRSGVTSPKPEIQAGIGSGFSMYGREALKSPGGKSRAMSPTRSSGGDPGGWAFVGGGDAIANFGSFGDALKSPGVKSNLGLSQHTADVNIDEVQPPSSATPNGTHISRAPSRQSQRSPSISQPVNTNNAGSVKGPHQPAQPHLPAQPQFPAQAQSAGGISISVAADGTTFIHLVSLAFLFARYGVTDDINMTSNHTF